MVKGLMKQQLSTRKVVPPRSTAQRDEIFRRWQKSDWDRQIKKINDHQLQQYIKPIEQRLSPEEERQNLVPTLLSVSETETNEVSAGRPRVSASSIRGMSQREAASLQFEGHVSAAELGRC